MLVSLSIELLLRILISLGRLGKMPPLCTSYNAESNPRFYPLGLTQAARDITTRELMRLSGCSDSYLPFAPSVSHLSSYTCTNTKDFHRILLTFPTDLIVPSLTQVPT